MSEEQFKIWKQVEAKGLEKLEKVEKALASTEKEEVDDTPRLTDEEKLFLKVFGIEEDQPAAAMKEATYFTCIKKLSEAVAKTPLYLTQDTETGERRAKEHPLYELLSLRPNPYMTAVDFWKAIEATRQHEGIAGAVKVYGRKGKIEALYPCTIEGITIDDAGVLRSTKKHKVLVDFKVPGTGMNESAFYEDFLQRPAGSFWKDLTRNTR